MARVTVEDCVQKISNRFDLVIMAAQRARAVSAGAALTIERDGDKNPVVALREIADETVAAAELEESVVRSHQKFIETDEPADDEVDIESMQRELMGEMPTIDDVQRDEDGLPAGMVFEDDMAAMEDESAMMQPFGPAGAADPSGADPSGADLGAAPQPPAADADFADAPQPDFGPVPEADKPAE